MPYLRILDWNLKNLLSYLKLAPSNLSDCKISWKNQKAYIRDQKCLIWVILDWNSKKVLSYSKSASWALSYGKVWRKNKNP